MSNVSPPPSGNSPGFIDRAETFAESDVTVSHTDTVVRGESLQLPPLYDYATFNNDSTLTEAGEKGILFTPDDSNVDLKGTFSPASTGHDTVYIRQQSNGSLVASQSVTNTDGGESFEFIDPGLSGGTQYRLTADDDGGGRVANQDSSVSRSQEWGTVDTGWNTGNTFDTAYVFGSIATTTTTTSNTGSATVEWPHPTDLFDWDAATYIPTPDGETIEIYVEESTDGGESWTEVAGPISRGDTIPSEPDAEVRFRVELSRATTSNEPKVEGIYRRFTV